MTKTLVGTIDPDDDNHCETCGRVQGFCICEEEIPEVKVEDLKEMVAWFPKKHYVLEADENGYIVYSKFGNIE